MTEDTVIRAMEAHIVSIADDHYWQALTYCQGLNDLRAGDADALDWAIEVLTEAGEI